MLETINDYISFFTLILLVFISLRLFVASLKKPNKASNTKFSIIHDYADNEDD